MNDDIRILLDDKEITRVQSLHIGKNTRAEANDFNFTIENGGDRYTDIFYQASGELIQVKIIGTVCFRGFVDTADFPYIPQEMITVSGRDYTGLLIDQIISSELAIYFTGKTASQIVGIIADKYGFKKDLEATANTYLDDKLYAGGMPAWDVIRNLAEKEGFDAYVTKDKTVIFKKREIPSNIKRVYSKFVGLGIVPSQLEINQDKTLTLALKVQVIGYHPTLGRISYIAASNKCNRENYKIITVWDETLKSKKEVAARAEALLRQYSKDLTIGSLTVPVDPDLEPGDGIEIKGIKLAGKYYVTDVDIDYGVDGFLTTVKFASKVLTEAKTVEA